MRPWLLRRGLVPPTGIGVSSRAVSRRPRRPARSPRREDGQRPSVVVFSRSGSIAIQAIGRPCRLAEIGGRAATSPRAAVPNSRAGTAKCGRRPCGPGIRRVCLSRPPPQGGLEMHGGRTPSPRLAQGSTASRLKPVQQTSVDGDQHAGILMPKPSHRGAHPNY